MVRLEGACEKLEMSLFETLLSPEGSKELYAYNELFLSPSGEKTQPLYLTNRQDWPERHYVSIRVFRMSFYFEDASLYDGHMQMGTTLVPRPDCKSRAPLHMLHANPNARGPALEFYAEPLTIYLCPRQHFSLLVTFSPSLIERVNNAKGRKFLRFHIDGVVARDQG